MAHLSWQQRTRGPALRPPTIGTTGILDGDRYIEQLLSSKEDVRLFRLILRDAGADKWLHDRHFATLKKLGCAELDEVTYASVASFFDPAE